MSILINAHTYTQAKIIHDTYFHKFKNSIQRLPFQVGVNYRWRSMKYTCTHTHIHTYNSWELEFLNVLYAMQYDIVISYNVYTILSIYTRKDDGGKKEETLFY